MRLILVSGSACSGKTTLAKALEAKFDTVRISVEDYRAEVYARRGFANAEEKDDCKREAQELAYGRMKEALDAGHMVVVDHCFGERDVEGLDRVLKDVGDSCKVLIIRLHCKPEVGYKRYLDRRKSFEVAKARYSHVYPAKKASDVDLVWKLDEFVASTPEGCDTFTYGNAEVVDVDTAGITFEVHEQAVKYVEDWLNGGQAEA